jgi:hypothetical protein
MDDTPIVEQVTDALGTAVTATKRMAKKAVRRVKKAVGKKPAKKRAAAVKKSTARKTSKKKAKSSKKRSRR